MAKREIPNLPGNSNTERDTIDIREEPVRSVEKVDTSDTEVKTKQVAQARVRKQSLARKFLRYILADTIETARERTIKDVLLPGIRNLIFDTGNEMMAMLLFPGESDRPSGYRGGYSKRKGERTSYDKYYRDKDRRNSTRRESYRDSAYDPDDIILDTRAQANDALDELDFIIHKYGQASIANFYDIVGVTGEWTDNRYGWTSLRGAGVKPVRDGFMIILPPTRVLDD